MIRPALLSLLLPLLCAAAWPAHAAEIDLGTTRCATYAHELLREDGPAGPSAGGVAVPAPAPVPARVPADPINTVMWLFGYSVALSGERVMYGDALTAFGFALDAECKNHPDVTLIDALKAVRPKRDKPMNLTAVTCSDFEARHAASARSDAESADTILMWLYGYAVGHGGSRRFDAAGLRPFEASLAARCAQEPESSLYDALVALRPPPRSR